MPGGHPDAGATGSTPAAGASVASEIPRLPGVRHRDLSPDRNVNGEIEPEEWIKACPCFEVKEESFQE